MAGSPIASQFFADSYLMRGFKRCSKSLTAPCTERPGHGHSLVPMLVAGAGLIFTAVAALFALNLMFERTTAVDVARRATTNLAESLARQASDAFAATDCALFGLAERVQVEPQTADGRTQLQKWMAMQVAMVPRMHALLVVDERGRLLASDTSSVPGLVNDNRDISYFRNHPDTSVRIALNDGKNGWNIHVSRRVDRTDGSFAGAVIAVIEPAYFAQLYASVDVGRRGIVALVADDGTVLVRKPMAFIGRRQIDAEVPYVQRAANSGIFLSLPADNVQRMFAFRRLDQYPLTIVAGVAESEYLAGWRATALLNAVAVLLVAVMIGASVAGLRVQIQRRKRAEDTLARQALLDGLTGVANRRQFDAVLEREWNRAQRDGSALALLMIDVDNFKAYNDRYGHLAGDKVLVAIAQTISACVVRSSDLAARYGGEEFGVILPATNTAGAWAIAERIRAAIVALSLPHDDAAGAIVTVSVGVAALSPSLASGFSFLVQTADSALYDAKRGGRNRTAVMPEELAARS